MVDVSIMGGLGNQMFEYAALRAYMLKNNVSKGYLNINKLSNKTHNIFSLDHFSINKEVVVINKWNIREIINYMFYGLYFVLLIKIKFGFSILAFFNRFLLNPFGMYCAPDGYFEFRNSKKKNVNLFGYFASYKYFDEYREVIKKELRVKDKISKKNKTLLNSINNTNSVCLHIRRGDYVGTDFSVCTDDYYHDAIKVIKDKTIDPVFYIFSDDINWVKDNFDVSKINAVFVDNNNSNYEELQLMYSCKHFIISNSTFSWWAQYLSTNDKKIVVSPSMWNKNKNKRCDLIMDDWILVDA